MKKIQLTKDEEIDRILNMSEQEILNETRKEGKDPEEIAIEVEAIFYRALLQVFYKSKD